MQSTELILSVKNHAGLRTAREAERAIRSTLGAMACALANDDARALSNALPKDLRRSLARGTAGSVEKLDDLYAESARRERIGPGFAREHTQVVLEVLATALEPELIERIRKHLPADIASLLRPSDASGEPPPPHVHAHPEHRPSPIQTLSRARPGTGEPIAEAAHVLAHAGSVARSRTAHSERMVETARSTRPAREDETLASARDDRRRR